MNTSYKSFIVIILICCLFQPTIILATTEEEVYAKNIAERLEVDMQIFERLIETIEENNIEKYFLILELEQDEFQESYRIYKNRPSGLSSEALGVGEKLEQASLGVVNGIKLLFSLPENASESDVMEAINQIISGVEKYEEAGIMINSLIEEYESTRNIYLYGLFLGIGGFILFLFFGRSSSKRVAMSSIRNGFFFIALGSGITLAMFEWMPGDTYFILWGLPVYGGYLIIKGIHSFFTEKADLENSVDT